MKKYFPSASGLSVGGILELLNNELTGTHLVHESQITDEVAQRFVDGLHQATSDLFSEEESVDASKEFCKQLGTELVSQYRYESSIEFTEDLDTLISIIKKPAFQAWLVDNDAMLGCTRTREAGMKLDDIIDELTNLIEEGDG